ncbi:unnamed protein product, partial [marine sediment metagenome]
DGRNKAVKKRSQIHEHSFRIASVVVVTIAILFLVFFWNINKAVSQAEPVPYAPSDGWHESLLWMKDNTPEPFDDPDAYYALYESPPPGESFEYPESAYGVTSWWDYGYWITRTAQRIPNANPSQAQEPIKKVAAYLLSTDVPHNQEILDITREFNTRYVIIDFAMTLSKFPAIANWAGVPVERYLEIYLIRKDRPQNSVINIPVRIFGESLFIAVYICCPESCPRFVRIGQLCHISYRLARMLTLNYTLFR